MYSVRYFPARYYTERYWVSVGAEDLLVSTETIYYITPVRTRQTFRLVTYEGSAETIKFDYRPWVEDNGDVTGVTVSVKHGDVSVSNERLAGNVKEFLVTTNTPGWSVIKLAATTGTNIDIQHFKVFTRRLKPFIDDYGMFG